MSTTPTPQPPPYRSWDRVGFTKQMDQWYPAWRYDAPPGTRPISVDGQRFIAQFQTPDVEPYLLCQAKVQAGEVFVALVYGVEWIEYPRDADNRVFPRTIPPAAPYNIAQWYLKYRDIVNPITGNGRDEANPGGLSGQRVFQYYHRDNGAVPVIERGEGIIKLFFEMGTLANSPWQLPIEGASIVGRINGYAIPYPHVTPPGIEPSQFPPTPWKPTY